MRGCYERRGLCPRTPGTGGPRTPGRGGLCVAILATTVSVAAFWAAAFTAAADLAPFSDYAVILERKPFGDLAKATQPKAADPSAEALAAQEKKDQQALARQVDLVALNVTPSGKIAVGLVDKSTKPPKSLYLGVGETEAGYSVRHVNFKEETVSLEKDGTTITLKLGRGLVDAPSPTDGTNDGGSAPEPPAVVAPEPPAVVANDGRSGAVNGGLPRGIRPPGVGMGPGGYRDAIRQRRIAENIARSQEREALRAELRDLAETTSKEAANKREREMNLELLKRGERPLSEIELTPEEDAELVQKGVLSPETPQ